MQSLFQTLCFSCPSLELGTPMTVPLWLFLPLTCLYSATVYLIKCHLTFFSNTGKKFWSHFSVTLLATVMSLSPPICQLKCPFTSVRDEKHQEKRKATLQARYRQCAGTAWWATSWIKAQRGCDVITCNKTVGCDMEVVFRNHKVIMIKYQQKLTDKRI